MKDQSETETGDEMTDAEADYWDEFFTQNPPVVDPAKIIGELVRKEIAQNGTYGKSAGTDRYCG
jgi:hypothetical protein